MEIGNFVSFTLAIVLLFVGKVVLNRSQSLRRYSIPEPVIGGFLAAIVVAVLYFAFDYQVTFALDAQSYLLLYFFAGIGLNSDIRDFSDRREAARADDRARGGLHRDAEPAGDGRGGRLWHGSQARA